MTLLKIIRIDMGKSSCKKTDMGSQGCLQFKKIVNKKQTDWLKHELSTSALAEQIFESPATGRRN